MPRRPFEQKLARLKQLDSATPAAEAAGEIGRALGGASGLLAAEASRAAGRLGLAELAPAIAAAYRRFLSDPVRRDPGCHAKVAAAEALDALECPDAGVFLHGVRYVQMEPAYGPPVDAAARLRAACASALYRMGHPQLPYETVSLLADREPEVRSAAVRILADLGDLWCVLLLRSHALAGDERVEITGDCLSGLMAIEPGPSLEFVRRFLASNDPAVAEEAALAIGNSRVREACPLLVDLRSGSADAAFRRRLLLPIALTRSEDAFGYLLGVVEEEHAGQAAAALEALAVFVGDGARRDRVVEAVGRRGEAAVTKAFRDAFDRPH